MEVMKSFLRGLLSNNSLQRVTAGGNLQGAQQELWNTCVKVVTELKPLLKKIKTGRATLRVGSETEPLLKKRKTGTATLRIGSETRTADDLFEWLPYLLEGANRQPEEAKAPLIHYLLSLEFDKVCDAIRSAI